MRTAEISSLVAAIDALEAQRTTLGDPVVELAVAPLRERLLRLQRTPGLHRRQVTVLFAQVVESNDLADGQHDKDTLGFLSASLRRMADIVHAHQGRVLRFAGDGLKAAFGADDAREDDAERAVRTGLCILEAGREPAEVARKHCGIADFAVRVGVHTGDVALGDGVEADNTAMGAAVNVAARMEQSAPPGALRISHDTWSHVRGLFAAHPQAPLQVKGIETPIRTYLVRAALDRHVATVERGLDGLLGPLVGREAELRQLRRAVSQAQVTGHAQALTLVADAGLGKSRLVRECMAVPAPDLPACRWLVVRSQPDGMLRPWGLLRSLLAVQFGIADTDSADVARRKLEDGLIPWFPERGERQAQLIGQLSGLDFGDSPHIRGLDARSLRDQAFSALRSYLRARAGQGAVLALVFEDLHWADDGSLDLLQHLMAHAARLPLALVMTARPALLARRPDWGGSGNVVALTPLPAEPTDVLVQALLQPLGEVPAALREAITTRAEGNPYYIEELVRRLQDDEVITISDTAWTLHEDRLQGLSLPSTLVGLLQARLDALRPAERLAARQASVIGHVFWDSTLQAVDSQATQALARLQGADFVRAHDASDFEGATEWQFDHHLLHQVTYDTLLKAERRQGHAAVARWLVENTRGRPAEFLAMTGRHAELGGDVALAIDCFDRAAREARLRFANAAAESWLRRALALLGESDPARRFDLLERIAAIVDSTGDRADQDAAHAEMATLLERHPDDARRARLLFLSATLADRRSDYGTAERLARQSFELAERCGSAYAAAQSQCELAWLSYRVGDYLGAGDHVTIGLRWADHPAIEHIRPAIESQLLTMSAMALTALGRLGAAREVLTAVVARCQELGRLREQLNALKNLAFVAAGLGRWDEMTDFGTAARELAESCGAPPDLGHAFNILGQAAAAKGDHPAACEWHTRCLELSRSHGDLLHEARSLQGLGVSHAESGDRSAALQAHHQARDLFRRVNDPLGECLSVAHAALCEVQLGRHAAAQRATDEVLGRLGGDLAARAVHETIGLRWLCAQVLAALGDVRAAQTLGQLRQDVQARAEDLTDETDRPRLIAALPVFRAIVAAAAEPR